MLPIPSSLLLAESLRGLRGIDYLVVLLYLSGVLAVGWYFSRQQRESTDYFLAGRRMPWAAVGLSIVATMLSTITYLAAPGEMIRHGLALSIGWMSIPLAFLIVNFMWIPFYMKLRLTSIYEYLELRYGLVARWFGVAMFIFILRLLWMATIVLTASRAVAQITYDSVLTVWPGPLGEPQWTLTVLLSVGVLATTYTMLGGIKAVIWTDVVQFVVLFGGVVFTLIFVAADTGTGPLQWWRMATAGGPSGHEWPPLASWDITERNTILFTCLNALFWYCCTFLADQVAVQRYLSTPSVRAASYGNIVNFVADFLVMVLLALCGMALLTYYLDPAFQTEIVPGVVDPRDPLAADHAFPHFIAHGLPVGISGLVVAALFAVAMSSLDSGVNSVSTVLTVDVFRRLNPALTGTGELRLARWLSLIVGLGCTAMAWGMTYLPQNYNIIGVTARTFNCALGPLAALFITGMFLKRASQAVAVTAAFGGLLVAIGSAWWTELIWMAGLTPYDALDQATQHMSGPSPFLITPLSATSAFLLAAVCSWFFPASDDKRLPPLTWRAVVQSPTIDPTE